jgi:hypothetical protein
VSQASPDVFAGIWVICFYLVQIDDDRIGRAARALAFVCLVVSVMVHASHLLIATIVACGMQAVRRRDPSRRLRRVWMALATAVVATVLGNVILAGRPAIARGSHAFLMGRLIEDGIMGLVLDERCGSVDYRLCAVRDELPTSADDYLWPGDGVLQRTGGWRGSGGESWRLISAAVVTHPLLVVEGGLVASARQLARFRTGDGLEPPRAGSWVDTVLSQRLTGEYPRYRTARQRRGDLLIARLATFH